jgi:hypothetical protein
MHCGRITPQTGSWPFEALGPSAAREDCAQPGRRPIREIGISPDSVSSGALGARADSQPGGIRKMKVTPNVIHDFVPAYMSGDPLQMLPLRAG